MLEYIPYVPPSCDRLSGLITPPNDQILNPGLFSWVGMSYKNGKNLLEWRISKKSIKETFNSKFFAFSKKSL